MRAGHRHVFDDGDRGIRLSDRFLRQGAGLQQLGHVHVAFRLRHGFGRRRRLHRIDIGAIDARLAAGGIGGILLFIAGRQRATGSDKSNPTQKAAFGQKKIGHGAVFLQGSL